MKRICIPVACVFLAVLIFSTTAMAAELLRGPLLQSGSQTKMGLVWWTETPGAQEVRYGIDSVSENTASVDTGTVQHEMLLRDLEPSTRYTYQIWADNEPLTEELSFTTASYPKERFRFVLMGDTRTDHDAHQRVVNAVLSENPDFYINTGDLVSDGAVLEQWDTFTEIETPLAKNAVLFPVIGNHDEYDGEIANYTNTFMIPTDDSGSEEYYAFTWGNVRFIVLDQFINVKAQWQCASIMFMSECLDDTQNVWMMAQLDQAKNNPLIEFIIVLMHMPPYSSKEGRTGDAQIRQLITEEFGAYGVNAVLSGHDHYYEHGKAPNGIDYVISGGGGAPLYDIGNPCVYPHEVIFNNMANHYLVFDVNDSHIQVTTKGAFGSVIEEFTLGEKHFCEYDTDCVHNEITCPQGHYICNQDSACELICSSSEPVTDGDVDMDSEIVIDGDAEETADSASENDALAETEQVEGTVIDGDDEESTQETEEDDAESSAQCTPGKLKCEETKVYICADDGTWELEMDCAPKQCVDGACVAINPPESSDDGCAAFGWFWIVFPVALAVWSRRKRR